MLKNILVDDSELRRSAKKIQSDNAASFSATSNSEPRRTILAVCSLKVQFLLRVWDIWVLPWVWDIWMLPWPNQGSCCAFICVSNISLQRPKYFEYFEQDNRIPQRRSLCGKYFVIQLVCELQSSRRYDTPQRYGGLIALSWKTYKFRRVCSVCHYEIVNTVNKRNRARHI